MAHVEPGRTHCTEADRKHSVTGKDIRTSEVPIPNEIREEVKDHRGRDDVSGGKESERAIRPRVSTGRHL